VEATVESQFATTVVLLLDGEAKANADKEHSLSLLLL
jgi:hypothetical protein